MNEINRCSVPQCRPLLCSARTMLTSAILLVGLKSLAAQTYYVSASSGNNANAGTSLSQSFKTILYGYSKLSPGDTLVVLAGVYTEDSNGLGIELNRSGTSNAPITVRSEPKGAAVVDQKNGNAHSGFYVSGSYNVVEGFLIRNVKYGGISIRGNNNRVVRNEIADIGRAFGASTQKNCFCGLRTFNNSSGSEIYGNYIHNSGRPNNRLDHGIYLQGKYESVINNIVTYSAAYGIQLAGYAPMRGTKVYNNLFAYNAEYGITYYRQIDSLEVKNNILYKNGRGPVYFYNATTAAGNPGIVAENNIYFGPGERLTVVNSPAVYRESGIVKGDPRLNSDFSPADGSPAINAGIKVNVVDDFRGTSRPNGGAYDIGPFELNERVPPPSRTPTTPSDFQLL